MYKNYLQIEKDLQLNKPAKIAVAAAHDETVIQRILDAHAKYGSILVGNAEKRKKLFFELSDRFLKGAF